MASDLWDNLKKEVSAVLGQKQRKLGDIRVEMFDTKSATIHK